jgi:hypothetical protein
MKHESSSTFGFCFAVALCAASLLLAVTGPGCGSGSAWHCVKTQGADGPGCVCSDSPPDGEAISPEECSQHVDPNMLGCCEYDGKTCTCKPAGTCTGPLSNRVGDCTRGDVCPASDTLAFPSICSDIGFSCTVPSSDETCDDWTCTCTAPGVFHCDDGPCE